MNSTLGDDIVVLLVIATDLCHALTFVLQGAWLIM